MVAKKRRVALRECSVTSLTEKQRRIFVRLQSQDGEYSLEHECIPETEQQLLAATAQTTLDAICPVLNRPLTFKVLDLQLWSLGEPPQPFITTLVEVDFGKNHMSLPGICNVYGSPIESAAKAALDAVNRVIELYLK
ncbi:MAG: hypothetical protein AB1489_01595 [Acidobacteriota bacterium]